MQEEIRVVRSSKGLAFSPIENEEESYSCYGCGHPMHWVNAHSRVRNGITYNVSGHWAHNPSTFLSPSLCSGESIEHKAAKHAIAMAKDQFKYMYTCIHCIDEIEISLFPAANVEERSNIEAIEEFGVENNKYILDVGFTVPVLSDGFKTPSLCGVVEVYHTHAVDASKKAYLTEENVAWVEVSAKAVLDAFRELKEKEIKDPIPIPVLACALKHGLCQKCEQRENETIAKKRIAEYERLQRLALLEEANHLALSKENALLTEEIEVLKRRYDIAKADYQYEQSEAHLLNLERASVEHLKVDPEGLLTFGRYKNRNIHVNALWSNGEQGYVKWLAG